MRWRRGISGSGCQSDAAPVVRHPPIRSVDPSRGAFDDGARPFAVLLEHKGYDRRCRIRGEAAT